MLPSSRFIAHHNPARAEMPVGGFRSLAGAWLSVLHGVKLALQRSTVGKWSRLWQRLWGDNGRRASSLSVRLPAPSGTGEFGSSCRLIGQWTGARESNQSHEATDSGGNNNLLAYVLHWDSAPAARCYASKTGNPGQSLGFEHYLNCLHPEDVDIELQGIRTQLLNRQTLALSALRMRLDNNGWTHVQVRRCFEYSDANGELTRLTLQLAVDTSFPLVTD